MTLPTAPHISVDPKLFSQLENLELRARTVVEGFLHGIHRSPFHGYSVEFASHRVYSPGDDLRHVNWKLFARQKRLYVKEYDAETNMNLYLMLDASSSMNCASQGISKFAYGQTLAAALAHLALRQRDAVGATLLNDRQLVCIGPSSKPQQFDDVLRLLAQRTDGTAANISKAMFSAAAMAKHRGLVVVISDMMDNSEELLRGLEHFRFRQHEVVVFQVLDPLEIDLPVTGNIKFHDLESRSDLIVRVESIREEYFERVNRWRRDLESECRERGIDCITLRTDKSLDAALTDYLARRQVLTA